MPSFDDVDTDQMTIRRNDGGGDADGRWVGFDPFGLPFAVEAEVTIVRNALFSAARERGYAEMRARAWLTNVPSFEAPAEARLLLRLEDRNRSVGLLCEFDEGLVLISGSNGPGRIHFAVLADDVSDIDLILDRLGALYPKVPPATIVDEQAGVWFGFAWVGSHGTREGSRRLDVEPWARIAMNYSPRVRKQIDRLMKSAPDLRSGSTVILHGPAGTGKTSLIRALAWEWREHTKLVVVPDPDRMFGSDASAFMELLLHPESEGRGRLLVLEDAGELLTSASRSLIGQGLSRFLNTCDGLVGQGLDVGVLVTTNEPIGTIHPAVRRPGRCLAEIEIPPLTVRESNAWLKKHDNTSRVTRPHTLAELYGLINNTAPSSVHSAQTGVGFGVVLNERSK